MKIILAVETSCDETSVALVKDGKEVLANVVSSQIKTHSQFGGVVPELASRMHTEKIHFLMDQALEQAQVSYKDISAVAVTYGPGLEGALLVGLVMAKTLANLLKIPLIGINHLHGHIYANFLLPKHPSFPFVTLIVSGGHTQLVLVKDHFSFELIGTTRDDAAGEAFDKIARFLDLGYPGGPIVERLGQNGNPKAFNFPRAMKNQGFDFSFSGLKTAVIQHINKLKAAKVEFVIPDVCASFQQAVIDILIIKAIRACQKYEVSHLVLSGGVTANQTLRKAFVLQCEKEGIEVFVPPINLCTDNAAMIGVAAYYKQKLEPEKNDILLRVEPNLRDF